MSRRSVSQFHSPLAARLTAFSATHSSGSPWGSTQKILRYLDRFLKRELKPGQTITKRVAERWIASVQHLSIGTRINRISVLRQFCRYLSYFHRNTCCVPPSYVPRRTRPAAYIYTRDEVRRIMSAASKLGPAGSLRPVIVSALVGLLYATGIRIGEALNLELGDIDLKGRCLHIREGKFKKSRYVPISASTADHLAAYLHQRRKAGNSTIATSPVFVGSCGGKYWQSTFATAFLGLLRSIGLRGPKGQRGPRVHDLRHAFAVNRLLAWYRQGVNLSAKLPLLSTYLGHTTLFGTELYLHATAELLERTGKRFHAQFAVPFRNSKKGYGAK